MKVQLSHRLDEELASWATEYGASRGTSRAVVIEEALRHFRELSKGGVPDVAPDQQAARIERARAAAPVRPASSIEVRRRANPVGFERQARMEAQRHKKAGES